MKNKKTRLLLIVILLLSLFAAVALKTFMGPCVHEDGSFGSCHYAGEVLFGLFLLMAAESLLGLLIEGALQGICLSLLAQAAFGFFLPGPLIRLCSMATMRCQAVMKPGAWVFLAVIGILSLVGFLLTRNAGNKERQGK